ANNVADMDAQGAHTVVFRLQRPWPGFPYTLANAPGFIVAPSAVDGGEFTPIGAGPYSVTRHAPDEELVLTARKDYWGGTPYLDTLRFVPIDGGQAKLEALTSGGLDAAFLRNPEVIVEAREQGYPGFMN